MSGSKIIIFNLLIFHLSNAAWEIPELEYINKSVDPCNNFYEYTCGNFKNVKPKPNDAPVWDHFKILQEELFETAKIILQSEEGENDPVSVGKARAAYEACINIDYADKLSVPEVSLLEEIEGWPLISLSPPKKYSWDTLGNLVAKYGVPLILDFTVMPFILDANQNIISIDIDRISPDHIVSNNFIHPEFLDYSENVLGDQLSRKGEHPFETFLTAIALHLREKTQSFKDVGEIKKGVSEILEFMKRVKLVEEHGGNSMFFSVEQLQNYTDDKIGQQINLNWLTYLNNVFSKSGVNITLNTQVMIIKHELFEELLNLIKDSSDAMLQNFIVTRLLIKTATDSNGKMRSFYEQFRAEMGDTIYERSEYCVRQVLGYPKQIALSMAITYEYQRYHFDINKLEKASEMVNDLYTAFNIIVQDAKWLDSKTKENALEKAEKMITLLGYPDFVADPNLLDEYYENLRICSWDHFGNAQRLRAFHQASNFALLGKPRNRKVWTISPLYVNAFYNLQNNRILFPISVLNDPFFTKKISALDYGRVGTIIGHEITHGFDVRGKLYDGEGSLSSWWSPESQTEYSKIAACFSNQYSKYYIPEINDYVNSIKTLGENIADNGGLREAFLAFKSLKSRGMIADEIEGYTQEQLFFIGYGTLWCSTESKKYLQDNQKSDYPPSRFRVIGAVSNNEDFAKAFNCPVGSEMNPKEKCVLW